MINLRDEPSGEELILVHHAVDHLERVESRENQLAVDSRWYMGRFTKPEGLWLSALGEDDWWEWCASEMPEWLERRYPRTTLVVLRPDARVLHLSTPEDLDEFTRLFLIRDPHFPVTGEVIDWRKVALLYAGLVIAPYVYERRLATSTGWYYGWDCASGVVWDADAVERLEPIEDVSLERLRGRLPRPRAREDESDRHEYHH